MSSPTPSSSPKSSRYQPAEPWTRPNVQHRPDATIAVMGSTGTGKSTFIRLVTRDERIKIGYSLESETADVKTASFFEADGRAVTLIDTPGFDDSRDGVTDTDILKKISSFLQVEHEEGRKLNGLIYMHRINDVRVGGVSRRNLRMFQKLCGSKTLQNVVIVTTMWDTVTEELGAQRERELMTKTFKPLLDEGAQMKRFNNGLTSATEIISYILFHDPVVLQIQQELAEGKQLAQTSAGEELNAEMKRLIEKHQRDMQALREEFEATVKSHDAQAQKDLAEERQRMQVEIQKWQSAVTDLNKGLESVKVKAAQDRRSVEIDKEKQRCEFLEQIAAERQRWEKAAQETAEKNQLSEKQLRAQFDAKIKEANAKAEQLLIQLERDREERKSLEVSLQQQYEVLVQKKQTEWNQQFIEEREKLQRMQVTTRAEQQERDRKIKELEVKHRESIELHSKSQQEIVQRLEAERKQAEESEKRSRVELEKLQTQIRELKAQQTTVTKTTSSDADNLYLVIQLQRRPQGALRTSTSSSMSSTTINSADIKLERGSASADGAENLTLNLGDLMKGLNLSSAK